MNTTPDPIEAEARECAEKCLRQGLDMPNYAVMANASALAPIIASTMREAVQRETKELRGKADECWGAANYRLKYLGCLFRALGRPDDETIENNISNAAEQIREIIHEREQLRAALDVAEGALNNGWRSLASTVLAAQLKMGSEPRIAAALAEKHPAVVEMQKALARIAEAKGGSVAQSS